MSSPPVRMANRTTAPWKNINAGSGWFQTRPARPRAAWLLEPGVAWKVPVLTSRALTPLRKGPAYPLARRQCPSRRKRARTQTDRSDSEWLARSGRFGRQSNRVSFTLPGIDPIAPPPGNSGAEIGTGRSGFGDASHGASRSALCPGNRPSPRVNPKTGRTRTGNRPPSRPLCEAAHAARRTPGVFGRPYPGPAPRKGRKKAIIAVAPKRIRTRYILFAPRQAYRDLRDRSPGDDREPECPARRIQALKKYGYWPTNSPGAKLNSRRLARAGEIQGRIS
ncbi:MAG: hypothetical protein ACRESZ_01430 [Methylococcales bacterium]